MSEMIQILSVKAREITTKKGEKSVIYEMGLADGRQASSWIDPAIWGWKGVPGLTLAGSLANKPYVSKRTGLAENSWQFTADPVATPVGAVPPTPPTAPPVAVPVPVGTTSAPPAAPGAPSAVQQAFGRLIDKDKTIARESILSSVAVMLPTLARPLDQEKLPRGWTPADVLAVCEIFEGYVYRVNGGGA